MIIKEITYTSGELSSATDIKKQIPQVPETLESGIIKGGYVQHYYPQSLIVDNQTGGTVSYLPMTTPEKNKYDIESGVLSDFLEIETNKTDTISYLQGEIDWLIVKGDGSNTSDLNVKVIKGSY
jgi:hypothetical protein